ncbi:hypothetical protein [Candidatus Uabimicrobium amorphum]|uniref:Uncharacterized protein n=1 Tax=Uabimicrobium amorphum TaxID=2596890 RepID=A0A5S9IS49_UABAM|nr:hypothetical protein [Candidatus Uabimicrobium amorphum]BBM87109.1 hypothetical protein UABAM_05512 [Candidatus Uabimicrobium amorphum]
MGKESRIWVTGGYFDESGEGFVYEVDVFGSNVEKIIRFTPPEDLLVSRKGFTGATWVGTPGQSDLLVCGFCAVFRFSPPHWDLSGVLHQPCMNDLHHITVNQGKIFVVNTGVESIDIFDLPGNFVGNHCFQPSWLNKERLHGITPARQDWPKLLKRGWTKQDTPIVDAPPTKDYYQSDKENFCQKPVRDFVHINHVSILPTQVLVTSLSACGIYNILDFSKMITTPAPPHDGFIYNDKFWITCVDGRVLAYRIENNAVTDDVMYFTNIFEKTSYHGWCRGLMIQDNYLFVGITEIRRKPQYDWQVSPWSKTKTGIICWDIVNDEFIGFADLSEERHSKIFSIIESP